ncbi:MAG: single-strand selective monofunctional uracil DNA glycosylase [Gammaproteobacteria bacterium]|jgi:single-strand selective monofunctional uracil DNA glycosylase
MSIISITRRLRDQVDALRFAPPVTHVYNPLRYAWTPHRKYLERYGTGAKEALLLGMNPGPFGMVQTGVPFGEISFARDWLELEGRVSRPENEHPKRPIQGFACTRKEVSGARLWGWAKDRFGTPEPFFRRFFVWNYCPLAFMEESGRNFTPDKLPRAEREALYAVCDAALVQAVATLSPKIVIGIGGFAAKRAQAALTDIPIAVAPHPSPASPLANRGWAPIFETALREAGIQLD